MKLTDKVIAEYWSSGANTWKEITDDNYDPFRDEVSTPLFLDFIGQIKSKTVMDIGCAAGRSSRIIYDLMKKNGINDGLVTGVDISKSMLDLARDTEKQNPQNIKYAEASISDLSQFKKDSFEVVVSMMALMCMNDLEKGFKEVFRILKPNGRFIFSVRHPCFMPISKGFARNKENQIAGIIVSEYFIKHTYLDKMYTPNKQIQMTIPLVNYTISQYLSFLIKAGFTITKTDEPVPSDESIKKFPHLNFWKKNAALYFFVEATKSNTD